MKARISSLRASEFSKSIYATEASEDLIESIRANGVVTPIWVTEDNVIIAGHRRVNACKVLGIEDIEAEVKPYSDMLVIESNRYRQKTWAERLREKEALEAIWGPEARRRQKAGVPPKLGEGTGETQKRVARAIGTSHGTLHKVQTIAREKPELLADIDAGKKTVHGAYKAVLKEQQKAALVAALEQKALQQPTGRYDVIVVDPPWQYDKRKADATHRAASPYPDMSLGEIAALPVADCAEADCVLWLWTTNAFLHEAYHVLSAWGFHDKTILTWAKDRMGIGDWLRGQTEHCIMAIRGKPTVTLTNQTTIIYGSLREHSRKPEEFYALVEALCPGRKLELFAREERPGWTAWGLEVGSAAPGAKESDHVCGGD